MNNIPEPSHCCRAWCTSTVSRKVLVPPLAVNVQYPGERIACRVTEPGDAKRRDMRDFTRNGTSRCAVRPSKVLAPIHGSTAACRNSEGVTIGYVEIQGRREVENKSAKWIAITDSEVVVLVHFSYLQNCL